MKTSHEELLDRLFAVYREVLAAFDPGPSFVAEVWDKIRARKEEQAGWSADLLAWAPRLVLLAIAIAALLIGLHWKHANQRDEAELLNATYVDTLALDSMDEHDGAVWVAARYGQ
ncbi:MAG: hypothetical protein OXD30_07630 [Bryobacterales bacterium]|nr:hypothetical protein [Bryobacterales bacterium]